MAAPEIAFLSADVLAETGATASYLAFLVRAQLIVPTKYRNGRTNLFSAADLEHVRWAVERRGQLSVAAMRQHLAPKVAA